MTLKSHKYLSTTINDSLLTYYNKNVFSATSVTFWDAVQTDAEACHINCGKTGNREENKVDELSLFDLASLTKPLVSLLCILDLIEKKKISWEEPLASLLERKIPSRFAAIDLQSLVCHCSGLAAHENYWEKLRGVDKDKRKKWLLEQILTGSSQYKTGTSHIYSDLGYMLLGFAVEEKSFESLESYWIKNIAEPLGLTEHFCFSGACSGKNTVPTGYCRWSNEPLTGIVNDDNCRALGGGCGHAGLFGSSLGVLTLCKEFLSLFHARKSVLPISSETFRYACRRVDDSEWTRGFNLPSAQGSSSGDSFSAKSIGHLGFTGVSFWIDLEKELIVVLLTNRVVKGDDLTGIRTMRPDMHNKIIEYLYRKEFPPER